MSTPTVLFLCQHNAGRSQLGAALLEILAPGDFTVTSAGTSPADAVNPAVMDRMRNRAFSMFQDSAAAKGAEPATDTSDLDKRSQTFVQATRGIHW